VRIAVCHQTFATGDAIGNDMMGMCRVLRACGHEPFVLCERNPHEIQRFEVSHDFSSEQARNCNLILFHHSQDWPIGREFLERSTCPVVFKFHNVTPAHFFEPFAAIYAERCRVGVNLTHELIKFGRPHHWICDSAYNRDIVLTGGAKLENCSIAPPFNQVNSLLEGRNHADVAAPLTRFLFVGRFAPNKGHLQLIDFGAAYRDAFGENFELLIVGSIDPALETYWHKFADRARQLELTRVVRVHSHLPDRTIHGLFNSAHVYLTFSEHEGFCVPLLEAQAVGLPIVGSGAAAVQETAGVGQFIGQPPTTAADFEFYARLAQKAAHDSRVRQTLIANGKRNVLARFVDDVVENAFLESILPWLDSAL
jgi:glycosyltransferase involved in cell wall biosynthesis